jgi:hypothetical protein
MLLPGFNSHGRFLLRVWYDSAAFYGRWTDEEFLDCRLRYLRDPTFSYTGGRENIIESFYTPHLWRGLFSAADLQYAMTGFSVGNVASTQRFFTRRIYCPKWCPEIDE